jgi:hypothetical protein
MLQQIQHFQVLSILIKRSSICCPKARCTQVKMGRVIAEWRIFWVKKSRRLAEFGNRKVSIFGRAAQRKREAQLDIPVISLT